MKNLNNLINNNFLLTNQQISISISHSTKAIILILLACTLNYMGWRYTYTLGFDCLLLFNLFLLINSILIFSHWKNNIQRCILPLFYYTYWQLHFSMAFFRVGYLEIFTKEQVYNSLLVLILATLLSEVGMQFAKKIKSRPYALLTGAKICNITYYVFLIGACAYMGTKYYYAGGIRNYLFGSFTNKMPEALETLFFILKQTFTAFEYLNLIFLFGDKKQLITKLARIFFVISLFDIFATGGSTGILYLLVALVLLFLFNAKNSKQMAKYIRVAIPIVVVGLIIGLLIHNNRGDYTEFNFDILANPLQEIVETSTFDCLENYIKVVRDFEPSYRLGQFIYPYINFLPRSIFIFKPVELGSIIARSYYTFTDTSHAGFATSCMAEFYYDFGYIGIICGMIFLGYFINRIQIRINKSQQSLISQWGLIYIFSLIGNIPNWYTGFMIRFVYFFIFIILLVCFEKIIRKF